MLSDYMYSNDVIYTLSEDVKLMFKTIASINTNNKVYSNCTEFKLYNTETCNTMIRRNISYYLFIDDKRDVADKRGGKICIYPEHMFTLLDIFDYIKKTWFGLSSTVYGYLDNSMTLISTDFRIIRLPLDKVIKFSPGVFKSDNGDSPCLNIFFNTQDPIQISIETFEGLYFTLSRLDMLNYANTALSFMMLRYEPFNRVDYSNNSYNSKPQITASDASTASGSVGRTYNGRGSGGGLLD